jgi:hypothetical protein
MEVMSTRSWSITTEECALGSYPRGGLVGLGKVWTLWRREKFLTISGGEETNISKF